MNLSFSLSLPFSFFPFIGIFVFRNFAKKQVENTARIVAISAEFQLSTRSYFCTFILSPAHPLEMETVVVFRQHLLNKRTSIAIAFLSSPAAIGIADCNGPYFLSIHFSSIALCAAHPPLSPFRPSRHPDSLVSAGQKYLRVITSEICATGKQQTQTICHPLIIG